MSMKTMKMKMAENSWVSVFVAINIMETSSVALTIVLASFVLALLINGSLRHVTACRSVKGPMQLSRKYYAVN